MKNLCSLITLVLAGLFVLGFSEAEAQKKMVMSPEILQYADLKWAELPNSGGVMRVILWGDAAKGAYGAIYKFPAGARQPMHYHTNSMKIVVISGTFVYTPEGGTEHRLGPGSYLTYGPKDRHMTGSSDDSECVFFLEQPAKFNMVPIKKEPK